MMIKSIEARKNDKVGLVMTIAPIKSLIGIIDVFTISQIRI